MFFKAQDEQDRKKRETVADQSKVHVPLMMLDGAGPSLEDQARYAGLAATPGHKPGFATYSDAQAKRISEIREARDARTATAWVDPEPVLDVVADEPAKPVADSSLAAVYARRDKELSERWRA